MSGRGSENGGSRASLKVLQRGLDIVLAARGTAGRLRR